MEDKINREKAFEELEQVNNIEDATEIVKKLEDAQVAADSQLPHLNRAQRRAFKKKHKVEQNIISDTALKLNYIELIQKLRELNEKKEKENNESINSNEN